MALALNGLNQCLDAALVNPCFTRHNFVNGLDQQLRRAMLEENAADSETEGPDIISVVHARRHDEDPAREAGLARCPDELKPVLFIAKIVIEKHEIDAIAAQRIEPFPT